MKIGVDIDGVVADFIGTILKYLGPHIKREHIVEYNLSSVGLSNEKLINILKSWKDSGEYRTMRLIKDSVKSINQLYYTDRFGNNS